MKVLRLFYFKWLRKQVTASPEAKEVVANVASISGWAAALICVAPYTEHMDDLLRSATVTETFLHNVQRTSFHLA